MPYRPVGQDMVMTAPGTPYMSRGVRNWLEGFRRYVEDRIEGAPHPVPESRLSGAPSVRAEPPGGVGLTLPSRQEFNQLGLGLQYFLDQMTVLQGRLEADEPVKTLEVMREAGASTLDVSRRAIEQLSGEVVLQQQEQQSAGVDLSELRAQVEALAETVDAMRARVDSFQDAINANAREIGRAQAALRTLAAVYDRHTHSFNTGATGPVTTGATSAPAGNILPSG